MTPGEHDCDAGRRGLSKLGLTKAEREALKSFRSRWGSSAWRRQLRRLWAGDDHLKSLEEFYGDASVLMGMRSKVEPHLDKLAVPYSGIDPD